ncbi:MAG: histidine kinase [Proteobacteria bacterium SG_bin5]|nr:PEP-CTERM system histidine kinase PrsK [Sphingomonas sp.]OQW43970.1 MAG: histidine kinase [Proteobacteria bacterium SG_bin5]
MILWSHALAALFFALLALGQRRGVSGLPRRALITAQSLTALWGLAAAGIGPSELATQLAETLRNLAWLGFMFALVRRDRDAPEAGAIAIVYGVVALTAIAGGAVALVGVGVPAAALPAVEAARAALAMMVALGALLLVHHLHLAIGPRHHGGMRLALVALAGLWLGDGVLYSAAYAQGTAPEALVAMRGVLIALIAPLFALAVHRDGDWRLRPSRTVTYQSLALVAVLLYVVAMVLATRGLAAIGGAQARLIQTAFVFGGSAALLGLLSTPWLRAWLRVKLAKHLFAHRYDYRAAWLRFTDTLGRPEEDAAPLDARIVQAVANLVDAPAGLLLVRDGAGLSPGAGWRWDAAVPASDGALPAFLEATGRIVAFDELRRDTADPQERAALPEAWRALPEAWLLVPLLHFGKLTGGILLARPALDRAPDWEDFDLLRLAGRQVASYLAEARAQAALAEAQRFDEFNRRFAFILHDIKNLVSQLTLVARNAERHADNPEFRADMIATLNDSASRMTELLARLSQHHRAPPEPPVPVPLRALAERLALRRRAQHPVRVEGPETLALADPARLDQVIGHLLQNAVEASPAGAEITLEIGATAAGQARIAVIDQGPGMSAAFVRDRLFKPFVSGKPGGFGLGAYEARVLAEAMGGAVSVESREGAGTRFTVLLPAAQAMEAAA